MSSPGQESAERHQVANVAQAASGNVPELYTLGGVRLVCQGSDITTKLGPKHLALLIYLAHERGSLHPSVVIELLGRGQGERREMEALKRAAGWLVEHVPGVGVRVTSEAVELLDGVWIDTQDIQTMIDRGDAAHVAELYVGEFLEGFQSGSMPYDEWAENERVRLKRMWVHAMVSVAREAERTEDWSTAAEWWQLLVDRAPTRSETVASLLRAYARSGQAHMAAWAYADYTDRLGKTSLSELPDGVQRVVDEHPLLQEVAADRLSSPAPTPGDPVAASAEPSRPGRPNEVEAPPDPATENAMESELDSVSSALPEEEPPAEAADDATWLEDPDLGTFSETELVTREQAAGPDETLEAPEGHRVELEPAWRQGEVSAAEPVAPIETPPPLHAPDPTLREAEEAAKLFVERRYERVRHEVTSVRRDWGSVLSETWDELGPWRAQAAEWSRKGLAVSLRYSIIAGRAAARFAVAAARLIWAGLVGAWRVVLAFLIGAVRLLDAAGRGGVRSMLAGTAVVARGAGSVLLGLLKLPRALFGLAVRGSRSLLLGLLKLLRLPRALFGLVARGGRKTGHSLAASGRRAGAAGRGIVQASSRTASAGGRAVQAGFGRVRVASVPRLKARLPQAARIGEKVKRGRLRALLGRPAGVLPYARRYWYAPVGVGLVSLAFVFGPGFVGMVGGLREELPARLPEVAPPQLPRVTLPKVTLPKLTVPKVTIRTPAFIETSVSKIGELISRPLLNEPGRWIVVADIEEDVMEPLDVAEGPLEPVEVGEEAPEPVRLVRAARLATPAALTVALEADLAQSRFFSVVPRERALTAEANATGRPANRLRGSDALALAQAHGWTLVVAGKLSRGSEVDTLRLQVFGPRGDTLYGVAAELPVGSERLATLADLSRAVRRRLGEPEEDVATSAPATALLSTSEPALNAYARARLHVVRGHYFEAINAAREATGHDATFAKAFHLLADAYAQRGQRIQGRNALESAWVYSERVGERERLRITADRLAWDGRYAKAVLAYDELFQQFRDDAGALRSLAILQRVLGARGGGLGNLAVSYEMDPHDWPSLSHLARYLGYRGRLPDVDSLQAALRQPPAANPALEPAPLNE